MKKIAVLNFKGGTGKTTTVRTIAYLLATDYKKRVLMCDLDYSGNLSAAFGRKPNDGDGECITRILLDESADPHDYILETDTPGCSILPSNDTLKPLDTRLRGEDIPPMRRLVEQLKKVEDEYDICLFDCPPSEDFIVIYALVAANEVIVPCTVNQDSLDGVLRVAKKISAMSGYNPGLVLKGILMTMISNNSVDKEGTRGDGIALPNGKVLPKFTTYIRASIDVEKSRFMNISIREFNKRCASSCDYENLVAEYLGLPPVHENVPYLNDAV